MIFLLLIIIPLCAADNNQELEWLKNKKIELTNRLNRLKLTQENAYNKKMEEALSDSDDETIATLNAPENSSNGDFHKEKNRIKDQLSIINTKINALTPLNNPVKTQGWFDWCNSKPLTAVELAKLKEENQQLKKQLIQQRNKIALAKETEQYGKKKDY